MDTPKILKEEISKHASLDDVFLNLTGATIQEGGDFNHAKQVRRTISHLD